MVYTLKNRHSLILGLVLQFFVKEMIVCDIKMHVTDLIHLSRLVTEWSTNSSTNSVESSWVHVHYQQQSGEELQMRRVVGT